MRDMITMCYPTYGNNPNGTPTTRGSTAISVTVRKTGTGTLRLNGVNAYTHTTEAAAALLVDGTIATSSGVTVDTAPSWVARAKSCSDAERRCGFICTAKRVRLTS